MKMFTSLTKLRFWFDIFIVSGKESNLYATNTASPTSLDRNCKRVIESQHQHFYRVRSWYWKFHGFSYRYQPWQPNLLTFSSPLVIPFSFTINHEAIHPSHFNRLFFTVLQFWNFWKCLSVTNWLHSHSVYHYTYLFNSDDEITGLVWTARKYSTDCFRHSNQIKRPSFSIYRYLQPRVLLTTSIDIHRILWSDE